MSNQTRKSNGLHLWRDMLLLGAALLAGPSGLAAQQTCEARMEQDPELNNLVHPEGYRTAEPGTLGGVIRRGTGSVDDNNFMPRDYAIHPLRAQQLWMEAASHPLPVWIRYLCESWAQDSAAQLASLQLPVLILEPEFDDLYHQGPQMGDYMQAYLHRGWEGLEERSERIQLETISDSRVFIMDDQPERLGAAVERFVLGPAAQARQVVAQRPTVVPDGEPAAIESSDIWGGSVHREGDRYVLRDAGLTIERPDASWELEPVVDGNPLLARMWDVDRTTEVTLQVRPTMGMALAALVPMVESNLAQQLPEFESVSTEKATLAGRDGFRMEFRYRKEGEMVQTALVVIALDELRMFSVSFQASPDDFDGFRQAFRTIGRSVSLEETGD